MTIMGSALNVCGRAAETKQQSLTLLLRLISLTVLFPPIVLSDGPAQCFFLDGSSATDHEPCVPAAQRSATNHTTCCILGDPVGNSMDICTEDGLCFAQGSSNSMSFLYQGGCTDSSLADEACRSPCAPLTNGTKFFEIVPCENGEFCCSAIGSSSCCGDNTFPLVLSLVLQATSSTTQTTPSTHTTPSGTLSTSSAASCTNNGTSSSSNTITSCPKDKAATVGASVGAVLGSILLAALATIVLLWRKLVQERQHYQQSDPGTAPGNPVVQYSRVYEADGGQPRPHELPTPNSDTYM